MLDTGVDAMSPERNQYRTQFEDIVTNAKEITKLDGYHVPIVVIEGNKGLFVHHVLVLPQTHGERRDFMGHLGRSAAKLGKVGKLSQVFMISEGWLSMPKEGKQVNLPPSQDPERKEVLIVSGLQIEERKKYLKLFEMVHGANNSVVDLIELTPDVEGNETIETPLLDAFVQGFRLAFSERVN